MKKILFHYADFNHVPEREKLNEYGGIGYYRIIKPAQYIGKLKQVKVVGKDIQGFGTTFEGIWQTIFLENDCFWMNHFLGEPNAAAQAFFSNKYNKKLVYDLDDNFLDLPQSNQQYDKFKPHKRDRAILAATLSFATTLVVSTEPIKERLTRFFKEVYRMEKNIVVIPNMNEVGEWDYKPAEKDPERITIGYSGSNSHQEDIRMVMPVIAKLMKKYKNLHMEFIGTIAKQKLKEYFDGMGFDDESLTRIGLRAATPIFKDYPEYLSTMKWDIGICPLVDTAFTRCKSHIKWMEYSMYKMPVVASRVYPYFMELCGRKTITDGVTGFLARNATEWEENLEKLILSKELREKIGQASYDHIKENWQYSGFDWKKVLKEIK